MPSLLHRLSALAGDIKLAHSVFALPFALLGGYMGARYMGSEFTLTHIALLIVCMFFARSYAMLANRFLDRKIDAKNPRTAGRALPSGRLSPATVLIAIVVCIAGLIAGAAAFGFLDGNWYALYASPIVIIWLGAYALFKRFSWTAHFFLGGALALSPVAAAVAVAPVSLAYSSHAWLLALFVLLWVAGFDIIYALQDIDIDRAQGLHSVPAWLGRRGALMTAKVVHLLGLLVLILLQRQVPAFTDNRILPGFEISYFSLGIVIVAVLLIIEHQAASRGKFTLAFFTLNGVISIVLCVLAAADLATFGMTG